MNRIKKTICGGMIGLAGLISGCTTTGEAWGRNVAGGLALGAVSTGVNEAITTEIAGPRASTVNVYQAPQAQTQYVQPQQVVAQNTGTNGIGDDYVVFKPVKDKDGNDISIRISGTIQGYTPTHVLMKQTSDGRVYPLAIEAISLICDR